VAAINIAEPIITLIFVIYDLQIYDLRFIDELRIYDLLTNYEFTIH